MKRLQLLLFVVFISALAKGQVIDSLISQNEIDYPQQKVHLHLDKGAYRAGETIWFKAYLMQGFSLTYKSKDFYAELIDPNGKVISKKVYPIFESSAAGNFDIEPNATPGTYHVRGYTTWMLNFDSSYILEKAINIIGKSGNVVTAPTAAKPLRTTSIQFFAEGGNLVNHLESVIAFKANDNFGEPIAVKGEIKDSKGSVVTTFASVHDGMGSFTFTPLPNEKYIATWNDDKGITKETALPAAYTEGVVLTVRTMGNRILYAVHRTENVPALWKTVHMVATLGQSIVYKAKVPLINSGTNSGSIPTATFPSGIIQLTVFSSNWEPLAESIVMVNNNNHVFKAEVTAKEINTSKRAYNQLEIAVDDTLLANMSVAVTDELIVPPTENIITRLLLTGDIKGNVYKPDYYLSGNSDSVLQHLNLVMLTHGWRRYNWKDLFAGKKPVLPFENENGLSINVTVEGIKDSAELKSDPSLMLLVGSSDSLTQFVNAPKTGLNTYSLPVMFYDSVSVFYMLRSKKISRLNKVTITNGLYNGIAGSQLVKPVYSPVDTASLRRTQYLAQQVDRFGNNWNTKGNVLETVTVTTKAKTRIEQLNEKYTSGLFANDNGYVFDMTDQSLLAANNVFAYLQGRVAGLIINNTGGEISLTWRGSETATFLDEINVDADMLQSINVNDIALIKVFRPPFFGAIGGGSGGAIAIYTRRGNDIKNAPGQGMNKVVLKGYASTKEFYSPNYATRSASSDVVADYRSTLYWNPIIFTDKTQQKVLVNFYNNDTSKAFRVILEGTNEAGQIIRIEKIISTK